MNDSTRMEVLRPDHRQYDEYRALWNGMIERRPAVIARCRTADDVRQALRLASTERLGITVRGGGHGVSGKAIRDGALLIDLSPMNAVTIDAARKTARVGGGARLGDLDRAAQQHGLATTAGVDSRTGVGGLTLGGGQGFLGRRFGLSIDNLRSADVVLANGEAVTASADSHPDLYWALRGGGGNFGVVTSFEFQLHDVGPEVLVGMVYLPIEEAGRALRFYRDFAASAPRELSCYALLLRAPAGEPLPEAQWGQPAVAFVACHSSASDDGRVALQPLLDIEGALHASVTAMPYATLQQSFDGGAPDGCRYYWKSHYLRELSDSAIDALVPHVQAMPGPYANVFFEPLGGAIADVGVTETAFPHREALFSLGIQGGWIEPADDPANMAWVRAAYDLMQPFSTGGVYSNYVDFDDDAKVAEAFGPNVDRLRRVKERYDPEGVFEGNKRLATP
jgi:FAD/FMN-containing dehydrogenase